MIYSLGHYALHFIAVPAHAVYALLCAPYKSTHDIHVINFACARCSTCWLALHTLNMRSYVPPRNLLLYCVTRYLYLNLVCDALLIIAATAQAVYAPLCAPCTPTQDVVSLSQPHIACVTLYSFSWYPLYYILSLDIFIITFDALRVLIAAFSNILRARMYFACHQALAWHPYHHLCMCTLSVSSLSVYALWRVSCTCFIVLFLLISSLSLSLVHDALHIVTGFARNVYALLCATCTSIQYSIVLCHLISISSPWFVHDALRNIAAAAQLAVYAL